MLTLGEMSKKSFWPFTLLIPIWISNPTPSPPNAPPYQKSHPLWDYVRTLRPKAKDSNAFLTILLLMRTSTRGCPSPASAMLAMTSLTSSATPIQNHCKHERRSGAAWNTRYPIQKKHCYWINRKNIVTV